MVEYGADTWNVEEPKNNFTQLQNRHISAPFEREIAHKQPEATGQVPPQEEPNGGDIKEDNARLLAQMPASRVSRKPGGNNRQERMDAVSASREDGNRGAGNKLARQPDWTERRSSAFGGKSQCAVEQRKSISSFRLTNVTALPTANEEVTRTRWHGQHAIVVATEEVHPGGKNGKSRDCHAEQLVKTWWQWCHTST